MLNTAKKVKTINQMTENKQKIVYNSFDHVDNLEIHVSNI